MTSMRLSSQITYEHTIITVVRRKLVFTSANDKIIIITFTFINIFF